MKKTVFALILMIIAVSFTACSSPDVSEIVGTYDLIELTGTLTYGETEYELDKDSYEYYQIILREDGTACIRSKSLFTMADVSREVTWKYSFGSIKITGKKEGNELTEKLRLKDGVLIYTTNVSDDSSALSLRLVLKKQETEN